MTTIHAEITVGHEAIVLMAGGLGDPEQVAEAARRLKALTPLFSKSDPPGALVVPATWPAVVQLSATFGDYFSPGPALQAWIREETTRRLTLDALLYTAPAGLVPRPYQVAGAQLIAATGRTLIFDEPRCLYGDAELIVNRGRAAKRVQLRDLVHKLAGGGSTDRWGNSRYGWDLSIPTLTQYEAADGTIRLTRVVAAWASGVKTTYTVTTETGRTVRATAEHPFFTERGWVQLGDLVVGDLVHVRGQQKADGRGRKPAYRQVAGLPAHPYAHGANRRTSRYRVGFHRLVVEADRNGLDVEVYIKQIRSGDVDGMQFLDPEIWAVHHRDHDHTNNALSNLEVLTHVEHHRVHAAEGKTGQVLFKVAHERVASIELYGEEETYDIEVADDPHNFLADGFVVHNTGKTITTIIGLVERASTTLSGTGPALVVCPASVVDPWVEAWQTWAPHVKAVAWRGPAEKRHALAGTADVYVTSYETARIDTIKIGRKAPLRDLAATALVIDECHYIKNPQAERSKAVRTLAKLVVDVHGTVVALSGTPITHHPGDLWATLACVEPGAYPSRERWVNRYCDVVAGDYKDEILGLAPLREPEFRLTLLGQHRRVARADVMSQLPPKVYSVRTVELPPKWRKAYDAMESQMLAELPDGSELSVMGVLAQLTRLSQLASAPAEVKVTRELGDGGIGNDVTTVNLLAPSWKVDALLEILAERCGDDVPVESRDQVVCFAPSRQLILLAGAAAEAAGYRVGYIVGGQSQLERTAARTAFQAGHLDLVCATTGAGGTGITLSAAGTLVFLQRPWSLVESLQAEDRAEGDLEQTRGTEVIDVVARNTVDTRVRAVLRERAGRLAELVGDPRIVAELLGGVRLNKKEKAA